MPTVNISSIFQKLTRFAANAGKHTSALRKIPHIMRSADAQKMLKYLQKLRDEERKCKNDLVNIRAHVARASKDAHERLVITRERCDGYLTAGEMGDLFPKLR